MSAEIRLIRPDVASACVEVLEVAGVGWIVLVTERERRIGPPRPFGDHGAALSYAQTLSDASGRRLIDWTVDESGPARRPA